MKKDITCLGRDIIQMSNSAEAAAAKCLVTQLCPRDPTAAGAVQALARTRSSQPHSHGSVALCKVPAMPCSINGEITLLSEAADLQTHTPKALQRPCAAGQCLWCSIFNSCNACRALKMLTFYFSLRKRNTFSLQWRHHF